METREHFGNLIHEFHEKANICILKFSKDSARKKDEVNHCDGREYGPDSVFRFLPMIGTICNASYPLESNP